MLTRRLFTTAVAALLILSPFVRAADSGASPGSQAGEALFVNNCSICHQVSGTGVPGTYPPLAKSDWLAANSAGAIRAVVSGLKDEITVYGRVYAVQMPAIVLDDAQAADVLTYVLNGW